MQKFEQQNNSAGKEGEMRHEDTWRKDGSELGCYKTKI